MRTKYRVRALVSIYAEIEIQANSKVEAFTIADDQAFDGDWTQAAKDGDLASLQLLGAEPVEDA